jgi:hypothetical protein
MPTFRPDAFHSDQLTLSWRDMPGPSMWQRCSMRFSAEQSRARLVCLQGGSTEVVC